MGCQPWFQQLEEINKGLKVLLSAGLGPATAPYKAIYQMRGTIMGRLGIKAPSKREVLRLARLPGFSPGEVEVFFDIETGWLAHAYPEPGDMPVIHSITAEQATNLLSPNPDPDLVHRLMQPDTYLGE